MWRDFHASHASSSHNSKSFVLFGNFARSESFVIRLDRGQPHAATGRVSFLTNEKLFFTNYPEVCIAKENEIVEQIAVWNAFYGFWKIGCLWAIEIVPTKTCCGRSFWAAASNKFDAQSELSREKKNCLWSQLITQSVGTFLLRIARIVTSFRQRTHFISAVYAIFEQSPVFYQGSICLDT